MRTKPNIDGTWCLMLIMISLFLISCERKNDSEFIIEFSNGSIINESDLEFYDSSTCIFFLKNKLTIENYVDEIDPTKCVEFTLRINEQIIYTGIMKLHSPWVPPVEYYIQTCQKLTFESDVLPIRPGLYATEFDGRNRHILIDFLKRNDLLRQGIACTIDTIYRSQQNDSSIMGVITIKNHDNTNYYIAEPYLQEEELLNMDAGYLSITNMATRDPYDAYHSSRSDIWDSTYLNKLLILNGHSEVSFNFKSLTNPPIEAGIYEAFYYYRNLPCRFKYFEFDLNQPLGRVWVGETVAHHTNIMIE